ncbi:MAG: efflux RND transporter periplasmic adaptor subunit [Verrucomicrobia bacterium]|nr:efflux RND transporter periplasmic adaptor subunit [Verrucomicrobiota bacterium]
MKRIIVIISSLAVLIAIGIQLVYFFREKENRDEIVLYGNVDVRQVDIGFRVSGRVAELHYEEGDFVPKGSLMAVLDKSPYDSQIAEARARLDSIRTNLENANILLDRREAAIAFGGVSMEDFDNAFASRNELLSNFYAAEASLKIAIDNMEYTEVYAPTDGIILSRVREPGTVVNPVDPVYVLSVCSPVWIRAYVDEPQLGLIFYGMNAEIYTDSGKKYTGKIGFISPMAEFTPKTVETAKLRTDLVYRLRIYADNPDHFLKQGMPVTVKLRRSPAGPKKEETVDKS